MKTLTTKILLLLFTAMILFSCQKEEEEFIDETEEETITANSTLGVLLTRTSQNRGDLDDIIDGSDCVTVNLPIMVFANGQKVNIENEDDIDLVEDIFDQSANDEDTLEIVFPITVTLADFTQVTVNSQEELNAIIAACEDDLEDTIECIDFVYPLTFFTYNSDQQQTGTVTINSDEELYDFLDDLDDDDDFIALQFPVSLIVNGDTVTVNNNQELVVLLSNIDCDDPTTTITDFEENLTTGTWFITYYFDDLDETSDFDGYEFTFATDNSAEATNGNTTVPGTWNITNSSTPDLALNFGQNDPFDELDEDWDIIEITSEIIRLKDVSGGDGSTDFLTFEREPNTGNGGGNLNAFIENLTTDTWYVNLYDDDGEDETCDYATFVFTYNLNGSVTAVGDTRTVNGTWSAQNDSSGIDFILNFSINNGDDLNDDWDVQAFDSMVINTQDVSGGDGSVDVLNWGRSPAAGCNGTGGAQELTDIMEDGPWIVASYIDSGDDETVNYNGYTLTFNMNGTTSATNGSNTFNGTWSITGNSDLDFNMDFGPDDPFEEFNDDWDVLNYTASRVELQDISGGGGGTDTLVFEKI